MANAVHHAGPVSILVNANRWDYYQGGVMTAKACGSMSDDALDHGVQLVGFNTIANPPYWIVRNQWSIDWGMDGYIYLEYGKNTCGLANVAILPKLKGQAENLPALKMRFRSLQHEATEEDLEIEGEEAWWLEGNASFSLASDLRHN